jgi:hypothetical protein
MSVRTKFRCIGINHVHTGNPDYSASTVTFCPVWEQDGVNRKWSQATPNGKIEMTITNPTAVDQFELGKDYFVDFTPAMC